jgi:hypothetical protein
MPRLFDATLAPPVIRQKPCEQTCTDAYDFIGGTGNYQTATMDIADYLKQGGQTAGHRELWRLLRTLFNERSDPASED